MTKKEQAARIAEESKKRIEGAKKFEIQYGGGKEKLIDIVRWEKSGDDQAIKFLGKWTKSPKNKAAYEFIVANNLYDEKKEA